MGLLRLHVNLTGRESVAWRVDHTSFLHRHAWACEVCPGVMDAGLFNGQCSVAVVDDIDPFHDAWSVSATCASRRTTDSVLGPLHAAISFWGRADLIRLCFLLCTETSVSCIFQGVTKFY